MQFYHKCEKTVTGTLCSGIVVHYGRNTHLFAEPYQQGMIRPLLRVVPVPVRKNISAKSMPAGRLVSHQRKSMYFQHSR